MNETPLDPPKGIKSLMRFLRELPERLQRQRPIAGKGIKISEMPDGMLIESKAGSDDAGSATIYVTQATEGALFLVEARSTGITPGRRIETDSDLE